MTIFTEKNIYQFIILILLFVVGFIYAYDFQDISVNQTSDFALEEGHYIRLVYIGSSGCIYSNNDEMHQIVQELKNYFSDYSDQFGYKFLSTGIAIDNNSFRGFNFLNKSGYYDEIITGVSWLNHGANYYIWGDHLPGYPDTPQILLILTSIKVRTAGISIGNIEQNDILLKRITGMNNIEELLMETQDQSQKLFEDMLKNNLEL